MLDNRVKYLEIIKKAWAITWSNKAFWWLGFFMTLESVGRINFNLSKGDWEEINKFLGYDFESFTIDAFIVGTLIAVGFALVVLGLIARAGLIKNLSLKSNLSGNKFLMGLRYGIQYFWRLVGISLVLGFFGMLVLIALSLPIGLLIFSKAYVSAFIVGLAAILIFIPVVMLISFIAKYAQFYVVLSDLSIRNAIENGYLIFRKNIKESLIMGIIFLAVNTAIGAACFIGIAFPIIAAVFSVTTGIVSGGFGWTILVLVGIVLLATMLLIGSIYQVFWQAGWYLFFQKIAGLKTDAQDSGVPVEELIGGVAITPEKV